MRVTATAVRFVLVGVFFQPLLAAQDAGPDHTPVPPLRDVVDTHLTPVSGVVAQQCSDAEFLRRVSLDLTGQPPTADAARAFIADQAKDKRTRLVDALLQSPLYDRHIAGHLDVMLMERRANKHVKQDDWHAWLLESVRSGKPWNVLAAEVLGADGADAAKRSAARFYLDRASEPNLLARDIGRIFFGRDLQCAQCHDHPLVDDYLQSDYHGLLAFTAPGYAVATKQGKASVTVHAEKAGSDLQFESVFEKGTGHRTGPRMPGGVALVEPFFYPGDEYKVAPANGVQSVPKFSRRARLAELATNGTNRAFNENIANRLWALMFGRGLVHPVDLHHADNPPSHPELMRILGRRFAAMNFDIRTFLRELALSNAYQRSMDLPANRDADTTIASSLRTRKEQAAKQAESCESACADVLEAWYEAEQTMLPLAGTLDAARKKYAAEKKKLDAATAKLNAAKAAYDKNSRLRSALTAAATAADRAAAILTNDKELATDAGRLAARRKTADSKEPALRKTLDATTAAAKAPTEATNAARAAIDTANAALKPHADKLATLEKLVLDAREAEQIAEQTVLAIQKRIELNTAVAKLTRLNTELTVGETQLAQVEADRNQSRELLRGFATTLNTARSAAEATTADLKSANAARQQQQSLTDPVRTIAAAVAAIEKASGNRPERAELTQARERWQQRLIEQEQKLASSDAAMRLAANAATAATRDLTAAQAEETRRRKTLADAEAALKSQLEQQQQKLTARTGLVEEVTETFSHDFTIAAVKPLSPEQLCWAILRVTGVYDRYYAVEAAAVEKAKPATEAQKKDNAFLAAREREIEQRTWKKLKGNVSAFVSLYAAAAGQPQGDFFATADQALFSANAGTINGWTAPSGNNVTNRIIKETDNHRAAQELYLGVFTRMPTAVESEAVSKYLEARGDDRRGAAQELVWSLITSVEFRFNH